MTKINCSIVLYRTNADDVVSILSSLRAAPQVNRIIIIDNSPDDALKALIGEGVEYIHRPDNPGYGIAHNLALRRSLADESVKYHLVVNADILFQGNVLEVLLSYMDAHPECGLTMPRVLNPDGTPQHLCKLLPAPIDLFGRRFLGSYYESSARNKRFAFTDYPYDEPLDAPYLSGCFMLIRTQTLRQTGLFDENFFMYLEDTDLSRRIASVSATRCVPSGTVIHKHGRASYRSMKMLMHHISSTVRYFNKWGWLRDPERKRLNGLALKQYKRN
ncbi:glycosyltransferase [Ralstonia pickettii]|uniref:glycosyltransferase n=1 Tax=Ralstonia pickettii TaxID=329 RepID=UPI0015BDEF99|nr:glycosyltransferase family 2 protein [Ralstonia pickettii]NWK43819.1 glycosyltransferase family 2 protein [Ralstonia pickettii]